LARAAHGTRQSTHRWQRLRSTKLKAVQRFYMMRYRTPGRGQTKKRGFKTKRDAEWWANKTEVEKLRGEYIPPSLGRITVGELAPDWLGSKKQAIAPSHYRTLESAWRVHVEPRWGG